MTITPKEIVILVMIGAGFMICDSLVAAMVYADYRKKLDTKFSSYEARLEGLLQEAKQVVEGQTGKKEQT